MSARIAIPGLLLALLAAGTVEARPMYRYTNDEGIAVVAYQVPPEHVAKGYEVLNEKGVLVDVVPRSLTEAERANMNTEERLAREAEEERKRLQEWDQSLLLRYSTVEDIEAARDRALRDLRIRVSILKGKQRSLRQQVENYQAQAADQERRGEPVNPAHLEAIEDLRREMAQAERSMVDREREISEVVASYERDIERFRTLLEVVELRKRMARGQGPGKDS
jgi:vacuolar-type H+-ATPase subunit I/STV1